MSPKLPLDNLPAAIKPPASFSVYLELLARGVQIYACAKNEKGERVWQHKGPEADLFDAAGNLFGKHFGGPSWQAPDGGKVIGALKASASAPSASDIPWLLLDVKAREGNGVFTDAKAILRVATHGGLAPTEPCTDTEDGKTVRVTYEALYLFLK